MNIGQKIRNIRNQKDITLTKLAKRVETSVSHLSDIEREKIKNPSFKMVQKIANALDVPISDFLTEEDRKKLNTGNSGQVSRVGGRPSAGAPSHEIDKEALDIPVVQAVARVLTDKNIDEETKDDLKTLIHIFLKQSLEGYNKEK